MIRNRIIALTVCLVGFTLVLRGVAGAIDSSAVAVIAASLAILPVVILLRCFLDPCARPHS